MELGCNTNWARLVTERAAKIDVARTDTLDVRAHAYHRRTPNEKRAAKKLIGYLLTNSTSPTPVLAHLAGL